MGYDESARNLYPGNIASMAMNVDSLRQDTLILLKANLERTPEEKIEWNECRVMAVIGEHQNFHIGDRDDELIEPGVYTD